MLRATAFPRLEFARVLHRSVPLQERGRRECRVFVAPAALRAVKKARKQVTASTPIHPAFPARWFTGLCRALPGEPGFVATVALRVIATRLDPSVGGSGPHDFAVRKGVFVGAPGALNTSRPSHPASHVRDDRDTPLLMEAGWGNTYT